ncbi:MAG: DsbE family thiol:disulfide interchange protein [Hyphomicrobiaceae bacterium]
MNRQDETSTKTALAAAAPPGDKGAPPPGRRRATVILLPVVAFLALAGLFGLALTQGDPSKIPSALIGKPAPQVVLEPIPGLLENGRQVPGFATAELKNGKPAVVNFWASWCLPCVEEHAQLVDLGRRTGVAIYGVNQKDLPANAIKFLARHGNPFTRIGADPNGRASIDWGVYGTPESFIVDGKGTIIFKQIGPITKQVLDDVIIPTLRKAGLIDRE